MLSIRGNCLHLQTSYKFSAKSLVISNRKIPSQKYTINSRVVKAQSSSEQNGSEIVSGEWPVNWSLVSMEDCNQYYIQKSLKTELEPHYKLQDVMDTTEIMTASEAQKISEELRNSVQQIGCVPVTTGMGVLQGVIYESDLQKSGETASDIMQKPIAGKSDYSVEQAAGIMLKYKISNLPVVNDKAVLIGMVNSDEIFVAMEVETGVQNKAVEL
eukprot:TRINITY_DN7439_c3_g1_i1.p1 TRINITY_DN7439_c3_g1~~TRINITY_DN7439_c3_g1_i1.p1  ORF type:complete len:214 (+),score=23.58 TRINITY_DN7439_c3_g1_i1:72-713(+)